jgi:hypothetical protein
MKQLKVGLTDDVRRELEKAAKKAGRSASEEARLRLEQSLSADIFSPAAIALGEAVTSLADTIRRFHSQRVPAKSSAWTRDDHILLALKIAIDEWLKLVAPTPEKLDEADFDPETLGRSTAISLHHALTERFKFEREYRELRQSLKNQPALHWRTSEASGVLTVGDLDPELRAEAKRARQNRGKKTP